MPAPGRLVTAAVCVIAAAGMGLALASNGWLRGRVPGGELRGGLTTVEYCSPDDYDGCSSRPWANTAAKARHQSVFATAGLSVLAFGGVAVGLFVLFGALMLMQVQVVRVAASQRLRFGPLDWDRGRLLVRFHPARGAARIGISACLFAGLFAFVAPKTTSLGFALPLFVGAFVVCAAAAHRLDKATFSVGLVHGTHPPAVEGQAESASPVAAGPAQVQDPAATVCVRCGGATHWVAEAKRSRCIKCRLYQPPAGSRSPENTSSS